MEAAIVNGVANTPSFVMQLRKMLYAYEFYKKYGSLVGFSVRKDYHNKSKIDDILIYRKYVCYKEGQRDVNKKGLESSTVAS